MHRFSHAPRAEYCGVNSIKRMRLDTYGATYMIGGNEILIGWVTGAAFSFDRDASYCGLTRGNRSKCHFSLYQPECGCMLTASLIRVAYVCSRNINLMWTHPSSNFARKCDDCVINAMIMQIWRLKLPAVTIRLHSWVFNLSHIFQKFFLTRCNFYTQL